MEYNFKFISNLSWFILLERDTTTTILLNVLIPCNCKFIYEKDTYHWCSWILGSHLCDRFIKEGYFVIGMDNLITGLKI
jgi:hypothetical protein